MARFKFLSFLLLLVLVAGTLLGQEQTGSIQGVVTDSSGGVLPGATVEAINSRGSRFSTVSDSNGNYRFPSIPPGVYTLSATLSGMETATVKDLEVRLGQSPKVNLALRLSSMAETINVTAEAPIIDITSSAAATSIRSETFDKLPRGRDFSTVVTQAASANQNNKTGGISIDGASGAENRYIMDGVDTTNPQTGVQGKTLVTEFVDEVQVKSAGYAAEFGGATGGVINVITKTGTNDFKGSVAGYYNDRSWGGSARPILQLVTSTTAEQFQPRKDDQTVIEPSLTLGGPLLKDNLWFYAGYEPWIESTTRTVTFLSGQTLAYDQDFKRDNYVANLSGNAGTKLLYKGTYNSSGYETKNLLPGVTGRGNPRADAYAPDDKFENWTLSGYADFVASPQWFFSARGGRFNRNYTQSGISTEPRIIFSANRPGLFPGVTGTPLDQPNGYQNIPTNSQSNEDLYSRDNLNFDVSWFPQFAGTHRFKAGVQFDNIKNSVDRGQTNYLVSASWRNGPNGAGGFCAFCETRGAFGSAGVYKFETSGDVTSENTGFFLQDSWTTLNNRLTLNIGVRTEQERVPSYNSPFYESTGKYAIQFDYGDKIAPRLGASFDVFGNGRSKAFGSYGTFYDITKLEMPRGSFGGDKWIWWNFDINDVDWSKWSGCQNVTNDPNIKPTCPGMTLQSSLDLRHASNDARNPLVDPNLKPMESEEFSLGWQQELTNTMALGFRYVNKRIIRAIEDVGVLVINPDGSAEEQFFIANPGIGIAKNILAPTCPTCPAMPKAKRDYQGYEFEFTKRFASNWSAHLSYLYSKLEGNYSGLANSDEINATPGFARTSPNVNRIFDSLFMLYDAAGNEVEGPLGGDRPHSAKAQVAYSFPFGTTVGVNQYFYSGTPTTTELRFQGAPFFAFNRNDMGRTPNITQTDLNLSHDIRLGGMKLQLGAIVLNLFDADEATNIFPQKYGTGSIRLRNLSACPGDLSVAVCGPSANTPLLGGANTGPVQEAAFFNRPDIERQIARQIALGGLVPNPQYGLPNAYQDPREVRVFAKFVF